MQIVLKVGETVYKVLNSSEYISVGPKGVMKMHNKAFLDALLEDFENGVEHIEQTTDFNYLLQLNNVVKRFKQP